MSQNLFYHFVLTKFDDVAKNVGSVESGTVPSTATELVLAFIDSHGGTCTNHIDESLLFGT